MDIVFDSQNQPNAIWIYLTDTFICCHLRTQCLWDTVQPIPGRVIHSLHISPSETKSITFNVIHMPNAVQELSWITKSIIVNLLMWRVCYVPQYHTGQSALRVGYCANLHGDVLERVTKWQVYIRVHTDYMPQNSLTFSWLSGKFTY